MKTEFLAKAKENLRAAQLLFASDLYNASANRSYYAAFHAAIAALAAAGLITGTLSHDVVQAQFSGILVNRRKLYPGRLRAYLMDLQSARNDADYKQKLISRKVAARQLAKAEDFVLTVEKEINP